MNNTSRKPEKHVLVTKNYFENRAWADGKTVCGIDEAGRGCLAGPVVAAAVILPPGTQVDFLKDSKKMSPRARLKAFEWIQKNALYGFGIVNHRIIDRINIRNASFKAMERATHQLLAKVSIPPQYVVVDAMPLTLSGLPSHEFEVHYFNFGEDHSISIAAASIVAKVVRDAIITDISDSFPLFGLKDHKGYATTEHRTQLSTHQFSCIHRISFLRNISNKNKVCQENRLHGIQQLLCGSNEQLTI